MADTYLAGIDEDIFLDWSGGGTLNVESHHRARYVAALRAADGYDFEPLVKLVNDIAGQFSNLVRAQRRSPQKFSSVLVFDVKPRIQI
jgi:hypothetical protein